MQKFLSALLLVIFVGILAFFALFSLDLVVFACPEGHVRSRTVYDVTTEPDCTNGGVAIEKVYCTTCYHVISEKEVELAPKGHVVADGKCVVCGELDASSSGLVFELNGEGTGYVVVAPGDNNAQHLVIPEVHNGLDVVAIGDGAFAGCTWIKSVTFPAGVYSIGEGAFAGCTELMGVSLCNSISEVGVNAFLGCDKLVCEEYAPGNVTTYYIGNDINPFLVLVGTDGYNGSGYGSEAKIHPDTRVIAGGVFDGVEQILKVTIPDNVVNIGDRAFANCADLYSVVIGKRVVSIGASAFDGCDQLTDVKMSNSVMSMGENVFRNCADLTSIELSSAISVVSPGAFYGCTDLTAVNIHSGIKVIGSSAFEGCVKLGSVQLSNGLEGIGFRAFYGCESISSISMPSSLKYIEDSAFECCQSLNSVALNNGLERIGNEAFSHCESLVEISVPASVTEIGERVFEYCTSLPTEN